MGRVNKQTKEAQLQQIFRMLLENKTYETIASELNISLRTVCNYAVELDKRYGEIQSKKTDNTLFTEIQLFKNRMLTLYKGLEDVVTSPDRAVSGTEKARCAEIAANIAIDVIKAESQGIKAIKELALYGNNKGNSRLVQSIQSKYGVQSELRDSNNNDVESTTTDTEPYDNNRKF